MSNKIRVTITPEGEQMLVYCSECGPLSVDDKAEMSDPTCFGVEHLRFHGCPVPFAPPQEAE